MQIYKNPGNNNAFSQINLLRSWILFETGSEEGEYFGSVLAAKDS